MDVDSGSLGEIPLHVILCLDPPPCSKDCICNCKNPGRPDEDSAEATEGERGVCCACTPEGENADDEGADEDGYE